MKYSLFIVCVTMLTIPATTLPLANFARLAASKTMGLLRNKPAQRLTAATVTGTTAVACQQENPPTLQNRTDLVIQNMAWITHNFSQYSAAQKARAISKVYPSYWHNSRQSKQPGEHISLREYHANASNSDIQKNTVNIHENTAHIESTFTRTGDVTFNDSPLLHDFAPATWWEWISRTPKQMKTADDTYTQCKRTDSTHVTCVTKMPLHEFHKRLYKESESIKQRTADAQKKELSTQGKK